MSTTPDQERREYEELCRNNPNYTLSFKYHRMYQSHIKKWKPLIDSDHPRIYSDWMNYTHQWWKPDDDNDLYVIDSLVDNPHLDDSGFPFRMNEYMKSRRLVGHQIQLNNKGTRLNMIRFMFNSYVHLIEHKSGMYVWKGKSIEDRTVDKHKLVKTIEHLTDWGHNPFDIIYYTTTKLYHRREKYQIGVLLTLIIIGIGTLIVSSVLEDWGIWVTIFLFIPFVIISRGLFKYLSS